MQVNNKRFTFKHQGLEQRLDVLVSSIAQISRSLSKQLIESDKVFVDGLLVNKTKTLIKSNQTIEFSFELQETPSELSPYNFPLNIVYEDNDLLVVDKPSGLVTHPGVGNWNETLANALVFHFQNKLSDVNGNLRPGIVHRLDKDTSGLILIAKTNEMHTFLAKQLQEHKIIREYQAITVGTILHKKMRIDMPLARDKKNPLKKVISNFNSKNAITNVKLIKNFVYEKQNFSLIECSLETGRTHQIRVHLSHIGFPIYGDGVYGKKVDDFGQRLHAFRITFEHLNGQTYTFESQLPPQFDIAK